MEHDDPHTRDAINESTENACNAILRFIDRGVATDFDILALEGAPDLYVLDPEIGYRIYGDYEEREIRDVAKDVLARLGHRN